MSLATSNRDGGRTSESGHLRAVQKIITGEVLTGLNVSQRSAGANMSVDVAIGDAIIPRADGTYGHPAWNDAVYNQVIGTADISNPRRDMIVMYIDYGQTPSTGVSNNTNGVVKIKSVAGTPAGSPADPSAAAIQSSVGSGNPYIILARVRVAAGASSITNSVIDDFRKIANAINNGGWEQISGAALTYNAYNSTYKQGIISTDIDLRDRIAFGTRLKLWQPTAGWIYGLVHAIDASTITVFFGTDYALANEAIYLGQFSYNRAPLGFNDNQDKWTLAYRKTTRTTQATASINTWYNLGGSLQVGIGSWLLSAQDLGLHTHTSDTYQGFVSVLGTASNGSLIADSRRKSPIISLATTETDADYTVNDIPFTTAAAATIYLLRGTNSGTGISLYSEQTTSPFTYSEHYIKALSAAL
jgi:hypothetical protein